MAESQTVDNSPFPKARTRKCLITFLKERSARARSWNWMGGRRGKHRPHTWRRPGLPSVTYDSVRLGMQLSRAGDSTSGSCGIAARDSESGRAVHTTERQPTSGMRHADQESRLSSFHHVEGRAELMLCNQPLVLCSCAGTWSRFSGFPGAMQLAQLLAVSCRGFLPGCLLLSLVNCCPPEALHSLALSSTSVPHGRTGGTSVRRHSLFRGVHRRRRQWTEAFQRECSAAEAQPLPIL